MTDLSRLPTPLARMLDVLFREDAERQPFRAVHRLVDAIEVFAKLHTVTGVCAFSDAVLRAGSPPKACSFALPAASRACSRGLR
ncbi:MAG: hypothetical protein FJ090_20170 [Deltaproteobacteria bacterium]|nr:hypothetical protein [Deltaproteobacteria bacterium]